MIYDPALVFQGREAVIYDPALVFHCILAVFCVVAVVAFAYLAFALAMLYAEMTDSPKPLTPVRRVRQDSNGLYEIAIDIHLGFGLYIMAWDVVRSIQDRRVPMTFFSAAYATQWIKDNKV